MYNKNNDENQEQYNGDKYYQSVFNKFDKNKSGGIEQFEMRHILKSEDDVPEEVSKIIFDNADTNEDGVLDPNEFNCMIKDKKNKSIFTRYVNIYIRYVLPRKKRIHINEDCIDGVYEEHYTWWPPPLILIIISAIELTLFIVDETSSRLGPTATLLIYDPFRREEAWRFFTYMLVHIGFTHITINIIVQLFLGFPLEMVHKWRVMIVYFSGVVAGSLGTSIMDPGTYLAGASGGVYALLTGHIGTIFMNWNEMCFPVLQVGLYILIIMFDVGDSVYNRYVQKTGENIGYVAHFCGAIAGLLVGIWNLKNFVPSKKETYIWWAALTIYIIFMGIMVLLNVFWKDHFIYTNVI
ncbi:rhomboid-related protein 2-like isoform X1 [Diorhabda sublineata]|uniref:rhomboid-related protein 2-like isoform X1 n=2 Tax=Diorhabda sublineata TaxID=1163346 RepID=UPI0024E10965|nr:rhomboid-related protein 2-like isoform X1 [Diorhabda sublineata]